MPSSNEGCAEGVRAVLAHKQEPPVALYYLHRAANIIGTLFVIFVFVMNFADLPDDPAPVTTGAVLMLIGMIVAGLGVLAAWRWPLAGGLTTLLDYILFEAVELAENSEIVGGLFLILPAVAVIHLLYGLSTR
jgi:hypothetical protein